MKKVLIAILCLVMVLFCFTGCGNEYGIKLKDGEKYKFYVEKITDNIKSSDDEYTDYTETKFDKNGNPVEIIKSCKKDGKKVDSEKYVFVYDSNNCPTTCVHTYFYDDMDDDVFNYTFKFDEKKRLIELSSGDTSRTVYTYDDQGRQLTKGIYEKYSSDNEEVVYESENYTYTEKGYIVECTNAGRDDYSRAEYQYFFDENGEEQELLISSVYYNLDEKSKFDKEEHTYSEDGTVLSEKKYEKGEMVHEFYTVGHLIASYDYVDGKKIPVSEVELLDNGVERHYIYKDGILSKYIDYTYDKNFTKRICYDENDNVIYESTTEIKYNDADTPICYKTDTLIDGALSVNTREFDDKGRIIKETHEEEGLVSEDIYTYENDKLVKEQHTPHLSNDEEEIITYNFDDKGNPLGHIIKSNGKKIEEEKKDSYGNVLYSYSVLEDDGYAEGKATYRAYIDDGRPDVLELINKL